MSNEHLPIQVRAFARARVAFAVVACAVATVSASARDLPPIDRLADAPMHAASLNQKRTAATVAESSVHEKLGVPAFLWGQRGGEFAAMAKAAVVRSGATPASTARGYLRALGSLYALPAERADQVPVLFTQSLQHGGTLVKFRNRIDGIEVFREDAAVLLGRDHELIAIGGFVMGGEASAQFALGPEAAAATALADWSFGADTASRLVATEARDEYQHFELAPGTISADGSRLADPIRVKRVLFRLPDSLRPAWYVEVQIHDGSQPGKTDAYAYVIAADDGETLFRHNQTADVAFSYRVFAEPDTTLPFVSPKGRNGFPYPWVTPNFQGDFVNPNLITLQNVPFSQNDPWLPAGATVTTGNNVDAYADIAVPDGYTASDVRATVTSPGVFDHGFDPNQQPGGSVTQRMNSVVDLFYTINWLHDWFYDAGFDEVSGNAQTDNFGRGGAGGDSMKAEAQDYGGRNNANMNTPADGARPRMQMYIWNAIPAAQTVVLGPPSIAGVKPTYAAKFGPSNNGVNGDVALASPAHGCTAIGASVSGKIALIDDTVPVTNCVPTTKVLNAQAAGAKGVVIVARTAGPLPPENPLYDYFNQSSQINIMTTVITQADGQAIKNLLPTQVVNVTIVLESGPDRDSSLDHLVVAHEWGHYISNRLIGNSSGLTGQQGLAMGEGWGDFHAMHLLVKGSDAAFPYNTNFSGTYAGALFVMGGLPDPPTNGVYYGDRRYPYSRDMTKNPLTFKHIQKDVPLPASPLPLFGASGSNNHEVHNAGEVWTTMLWECYSNLLNDTARLTFAQAQDRMKQYLVAGYKLTPATPTFVEARDALLATMFAQDLSDYSQCLQGFAKRGLGLGAVAPNRFSTTNSPVVENFGGGALAIVAMDINDAPGYCDADGILDEGENGRVVLTLQNIGAVPLSSTTASITGNSNPKVTFPGGTAFTVPTLAPAALATLTLPASIVGAASVEFTNLSISVDNAALTIPHPLVATARVILNADIKPNHSATDDVEATPGAWTSGSSPASATGQWKRIALADGEHVWFGPDNPVQRLNWLQSPELFVGFAGNFTFSFRHRHIFEFDPGGTWDGGQIQISSDGGGTWSDIGAFATPGYNGTIYAPNTNPLAGLPAFVAQSTGYPLFTTVNVNLGNMYNGAVVLVRFAIGTDALIGAPGWEVDDIAFTNITNTPFPAVVPNAGGACTSVSVVAGTPQWAVLGTPFPTLLKAQVKNSAGTPVAGVEVTFAAPAAGARAVFSPGSTVTASVLTDAGGIATAPVATAFGSAGNFTATATAGQQSVNYSLYNQTTVPKLDIDANNLYDALSDGVLIFRRLRGLGSDSLAVGVTGIAATRSAADMLAYIDGIAPLLDVDGNGESEAETDGVMILRYMLGLRGDALIGGLADPLGTRKTAGEIEAYIQAMMP